MKDPTQREDHLIRMVIDKEDDLAEERNRTLDERGRAERLNEQKVSYNFHAFRQTLQFMDNKREKFRKVESFQKMDYSKFVMSS